MVGLYVHVPFCDRACPYCDFDFEVTRTPALGDYLLGLEQDWRAKLEWWAAGTAFDTVYIGGGTPSTLGAAGLETLLVWLAERIDTSAVSEWTLELNPEHGQALDFARLSALGVTRVSLGVQSFDDTGLIDLGRAHRLQAARATIGAAAEAGLQVCVDLMVGWRGQSDRSLDHDVHQIAASLATGNPLVSHVSVYGLTVEEGTPWIDLIARGRRTHPDEDRQADLLYRAETRLIDAGFEHYEVSNYARPGCASVHNSGYWQRAPCLGLGPSAYSAQFSCDGAVDRAGNARGRAAWMASGGAFEYREHLAGQRAASESLWLGLRRLRGIDIATFLRQHPKVDRAWLQTKVHRQLELGNLRWSTDGASIALAPERWTWHGALGSSIIE